MALSRVKPALRMPRASSWAARKASTSSISSVGAHSSMERYSAAGAMFDTCKGRLANLPRAVSKIDLPQRFSGAVMLAMGATCTTSTSQVKAAHNAAARSVSLSAITCRARAWVTSSSRSAPSTGSGHGSTSSKMLALAGPASSSTQAVKRSNSTMLSTLASLTWARSRAKAAGSLARIFLSWPRMVVSYRAPASSSSLLSASATWSTVAHWSAKRS